MSCTLNRGGGGRVGGWVVRRKSLDLIFEEHLRVPTGLSRDKIKFCLEATDFFLLIALIF